MKHVVFLLLFLQMGIQAQAQSLIDEDLQRISAGALAEEISRCPEVQYGGIVVQEVSSGNIVADISLTYSKGAFERHPLGNAQYVPNGLGRSVIYLCLSMMPEFDPYNIVIDTFDGAYEDADGYTFQDHNGYGLLHLKRGFAVNSDICLIRAAEQVFKKNMKTFAQALNKTGILFGAKASEDQYHRWRSREILDKSPMSLYQMTCWCNAVAGGKFVIRLDEKDSTTPYDFISSSKEALDSLRSAMRECVTGGLAHKLNSEFVSVAGITNVRPTGVDGYQGEFAACFFPYEEPKFTVAVYILRRGGKGYFHASNAVRNVIDWIAFNRLEQPYLSSSDSQSKHREGWIHPAER